jgi:ABC-2 type transport system permease protein
MQNIISQIQTRYRYSVILLRQMVATDFKLRYQNSVLGYLWSLLKPLALFTILYIVFVKFLKLGGSIPHFPVYLLLGIVIWSFFTEVTMQSIGAIVGRGDMLRKVNFPRYVVVLAGAFSALINLFLNLVIVAIFMLLGRVGVRPVIVLAPLLIIELFVFSLSVGFILSAMFVRFRDLSHIWEVVLQGAFYATPIIYPLNIIPVKYAKILLLNPMAQIIQDLRYVMITNQTVTAANLYHTGWIRLIPIAITVVITIIAVTYFRARSRYFAEEV